MKLEFDSLERAAGEFSNKPKPFQFGLRSLMLATGGLAVLLGLLFHFPIAVVVAGFCLLGTGSLLLVLGIGMGMLAGLTLLVSSDRWGERLMLVGARMIVVSLVMLPTGILFVLLAYLVTGALL